MEALCSTSAGLDALKNSGVKLKFSNGQCQVFRKARDALDCGADGWTSAVPHLAACGILVPMEAKGTYKLAGTQAALEALLHKGARRSCLNGAW